MEAADYANLHRRYRQHLFWTTIILLALIGAAIARMVESSPPKNSPLLLVCLLFITLHRHFQLVREMKRARSAQTASVIGTV